MATCEFELKKIPHPPSRHETGIVDIKFNIFTIEIFVKLYFFY